MSDWRDGYTYEMFEREQMRMAKLYSDDDFTECKRTYRVYWYNEEFDDSDTVEAYSAEEAQELAEELIPEDATITSVRVA